MLRPHSSILHDFEDSQEELKDMNTECESFGSQLYSETSNISSSRLNGPLPPVPSLKQPLISSSLTQSSASVRPQRSLTDNRSYGRPFQISRRSTDHLSPPSSYYWNPHAYTDIELAVDSAYHLPAMNDV